MNEKDAENKNVKNSESKEKQESQNDLSKKLDKLILLSKGIIITLCFFIATVITLFCLFS